MARIAFFSDDMAGSVCARLTAVGLARTGAAVVLGVPAMRAEQQTPGDTSDGVKIVGVSEGSSLLDVPATLKAAARHVACVVAALPLERIGDLALRGRFDAIVTVGASPAAAARALRAARYDAGVGPGAGRGGAGGIPAWFLAGSHQAELSTKARLCAACGPPLPFATRVIPAVLPRSLVVGARPGQLSEPATLGTALLLAALALAVASDPWALRLDVGDLAALMEARTWPAERLLSDRLLALASEYADLADGSGRTPAAGRIASVRRRPPDPRVAAPGAAKAIHRPHRAHGA